MMAVLAQKNGIDLWHYKTPQGGSLLTSLDFMARFTDPTVAWPYKSIDQIRVRPLPLLSWRIIPPASRATSKRSAVRLSQCRLRIK